MLHMKLKMAVCSAALLAFLPTSAYCGICFLPDCGDEILAGRGNMDINSDSKFCEENGYVSSCPANTVKILDSECYRDTNYFKCSKYQWCKENGYNITSCSVPQYLSGQCPNGEALYKSCKTDNARACKELGYTNSCPSGQKLKKNSGRCSYDSSYGTCCRPSGCPSNTSLSYSSYGSNGTDGCEYTCYYTCNPNCPSGTSTSNPGGCGGSTRNGCRTKTCYYPYEPCCTPYDDEWGCDCGSYSCSDGCGGTRRCCSSCPDPEPTPPPSGNSGSGSGSSGGGSSGGGSSGGGSSNPWVGYVRAVSGGFCSPSGSGYHWVHKVTKGCRNTDTGEENDVFTTSACYSNGTIYLTKEECEKNGTGKYGYTSENCGSCSDKNTTCDGYTSSSEGTCR